MLPFQARCSRSRLMLPISAPSSSTCLNRDVHPDQKHKGRAGRSVGGCDAAVAPLHTHFGLQTAPNGGSGVIWSCKLSCLLVKRCLKPYNLPCTTVTALFAASQRVLTWGSLRFGGTSPLVPRAWMHVCARIIIGPGKVQCCLRESSVSPGVLCISP